MGDFQLQSAVTQEHADLKQEQMQNLKLAYRDYKKKGGNLGHPEIIHVLRSLGMNPSEGEIATMIQMVNINGDGDGTLDEQTFVNTVIEHIETTDSEEDIKRAFKTFDRDGNGFINADELRSMFQYALGEMLSMDEIDEIFEELDTNHDGQLNYNEFAKMLAYDAKDN